MAYYYGEKAASSLTTCSGKIAQANQLFSAAGGKITEFNDGIFYGTTERTDLKSKAQVAQGNDILQSVADKYYCCPLIKTGYLYDYSTQSCRWKLPETVAGSCQDCVTKLIFNPKNNGGVLFNYKSSETTSLDLSLDYILNFDCDIFNSKCVKDETEINDLNTKIVELQNEIDSKDTECTALASDATNKQTLFDSLCYVIVKGSGTVPMAYYNYQSKITYINTTPTLADGNYCLTEKGLSLWKEVIGETKYNSYITDYGCSTNTYSQTDVDNFYTKVNEATVAIGDTIKDYLISTFNNSCDKKIAFNDISIARTASNSCKIELDALNTQLTDLQIQLSAIKGDAATTNESIANLEKLELRFNLEYEKSAGVYEIIYTDTLFNIGQGNLMKYIIENSPNTGILISGATAGGILKPLYAFDLDDYPTPSSCPRNRDIFIGTLYDEEYIGNYTEPTTVEERNTLNKTLHGWYNSKWLTYNVSLSGKTVLDTINNKKIRVSISIDNCCMNLSLLADNLKINKHTETIDNEEIIISESPKFELERVLDNKKSWVSYENTSTDRNLDLTFRETEYEIYDYRLAVNTKEIDLKIDPANAIEEDVLCFLNNDSLLSGITCDNSLTYTCPAGYTLTPANDSCIKITTTGATLNGTAITATTVSPYVISYTFSTLFYEKVDIARLPINDFPPNGPFKYDNGTGSALSFTVVSNTDVWGRSPSYVFPSTLYGRLNKIGINIPNNQTVGFTHCLDIPTSGVYTIGVASNNLFKLTLNGTVLVNCDTWAANFYYWHVFPIELTSGLNIIELIGTDSGGGGAFAAEIYSADTATLTGFTTDAQLTPYIVFSSGNRVGTILDIGTTNGYSCPSGYALNTCDNSNTYTCTKIERSVVITNDDTTCPTCDGCGYVDLDAKLTTDVAQINNVDEFRKAINSELIDVKNRQSISSYPTLKVLYERYLGNCEGCSILTNKFRYEDTQKFADLVGEHWIDLVEQFVPATTIWGSTEVYRNTVFDQQKYKYRKMPIFSYPENGSVTYANCNSTIFPENPDLSTCDIDMVPMVNLPTVAGCESDTCTLAKARVNFLYAAKYTIDYQIKKFYL